MHLRMAGTLAESPAEDLGAEAAAAHPEQHHVLEAVVGYSRAEGGEFARRLVQLIGHGHPAERVLDDLLMALFLLPQGPVFATDFARPLFALRAFDGRLDVRFVPAQVGLHSIEQAAG